MNVVLRPVTEENWVEVANLKVSEAQTDFIAPNVWSIAESKFYAELQSLAIYADDQLVGFLMFGKRPTDGRYWLFRFMIGEEFQGRGYGRAAMDQLIALLRRIPDCDAVNVGYEPANSVAEHLYLSAGFEKTGTASWGELTARLALRKEE